MTEMVFGDEARAESVRQGFQDLFAPRALNVGQTALSLLSSLPGYPALQDEFIRESVPPTLTRLSDNEFIARTIPKPSYNNSTEMRIMRSVDVNRFDSRQGAFTGSEKMNVVMLSVKRDDIELTVSYCFDEKNGNLMQIDFAEYAWENKSKSVDPEFFKGTELPLGKRSQDLPNLSVTIAPDFQYITQGIRLKEQPRMSDGNVLEAMKAFRMPYPRPTDAALNSLLPPSTRG